MIKILSMILVVITAFGITVLIVGYLSSPTFNDKTSFDLDSPPELVWKELVNIEAVNLKKGDVESVKVVDTYGKLIAWQEDLKNGGFRMYRMTNRIEEKNLVIELTDSSYGLTGKWYFVLERLEKGTKVSITEESNLSDSKIRGVRYFLGRNHDLLVWVKYIKVGVIERLLTTP